MHARRSHSSAHTARHWPSGAITSPAGLAAGEHLHRHWRIPDGAGSAPLSALPSLRYHHHPPTATPVAGAFGSGTAQHKAPLWVSSGACGPVREGQRVRVSVPATQGGHGRRLRRREQPRGLPRARTHRARGASAPRRWSQLGQERAGRGGRRAHVTARCLRRGDRPPRAASLMRRRSAPARQRCPTRLPDFT